METSLGIVVAYASYWPGNMFDNRGNSVGSRLCRRGMHTLAISLWWESLLWMVARGVVTIRYRDKDVVVAAPDGSQALMVIEAPGY